MQHVSAAPISVERRTRFNDAAWDKCVDTFESWKERLNEDVLQKIGVLAKIHRQGLAEVLFPPEKGSFNVVFRIKFADGASAVIRFPAPGFSVFPEEKVKREVSVVRFIEWHTGIRVPHVLYYGMTDESPVELGPFIVMEYLDNDSDLVDALSIPGRPDAERPILDPDIDMDRLRSVYSNMAEIMAEIVIKLARGSFSEIGCVSNDEDDEFDDNWVVTERPLTLNMNELVQLGEVPPHLLPQQPFKTASAYFLSLAEMHMTHLRSQPNAATSKEDCKKKYIARCLFRKLAREKRLTHPDHENGPFKLYCDDFRPANALASSRHKYAVVGVIDWEFAYAAPVELVHSPPFWLLLERPEYWVQGLDDWTRVYEQRLPIFLEELERRGDAAIERGILSDDVRLSRRMKESWENRDTWFGYAATRSWAFDMIYWARIDRRFFGAGDLDDRLGLLTTEERQEMDELCRAK